MIKIGLCGRSGSGKGYVSELLKEFDFFVIDTDKVYKDIISSKQDNECKNEIRLAFGDDVFTSDGLLNKKALADIVFKEENAALLDKLNKITHKYIWIECDKICSSIDENKYNALVIDAPLLFESGFDKYCDKTCCVISNDEIRIKRIIERDNISKEEVLKRLKTQISDEELKKKCDFVIENNNDDKIMRKGINELVAYCKNIK